MTVAMAQTHPIQTAIFFARDALANASPLAIDTVVEKTGAVHTNRLPREAPAVPAHDVRHLHENLSVASWRRNRARGGLIAGVFRCHREFPL